MGSSLRLADVITRARSAAVGEEQMVQGRVGKKDAEPGYAGSDGRRDGAGVAPASEDDGARGGGEEFFFGFSEIAEGAGGGEVADHDGERLSVAVLALAQPHHRGFICGVDREVEAADAFDGEDLAVDRSRMVCDGSGASSRVQG